MNVFFGKMNNRNECDNFICSGGQGNKYFGGMQPGDVVFIRLEEEQANLKRLWMLDRIEMNNGISTAHFTNVFSFNTISTEKFSRLKFFKIGKVFGNYLFRPIRGIGFYKLDLINDAAFNSSIGSQESFNQFIGDENNYRRIVFVNNNTVPHSNEDIQIIKDNNSYKIYNREQAFLEGLSTNFVSNRYEEYKELLRTNEKNAKRMPPYALEWLESGGLTGKITIPNLWDIFCSKQPVHKEDKIINRHTIENIESNNENKCNTINDYKNLIIYGIPGCGKSYRLKNTYLSGFLPENVIRTTFHPEYSNTDFVGQVRPVKNGTKLDYDVIPGPFTRALFLAYKNPNEKVALAIEEINRGNAAAIFGDLFQLLDRKASGDSEYDIFNETIISYLKSKNISRDNIIIPSNLYLYATMNTSDQNVFKLDTAFKRRWEFERLTNKDTEKELRDFVVSKIDGNDITWKKFLSTINKIIASNDDISGDRQIGNFFYEGTDNDLSRFANKVLEYLYNDVFKYSGKEDIFNTQKYQTFDDIYNGFINNENIFVDGLFQIDSSDETNITDEDNDENGGVSIEDNTTVEDKE